MSKETPWLKGLGKDATLEEMDVAFKLWFEGREAVLRTLKSEEKEAVHAMSERLRSTSSESEFLRVLDELKQEARTIRETAVYYGSDGNFDLVFPGASYTVRISVKPRRSFDQKDEPLTYDIYAIKNSGH